ncbi:MAG: tetratricopeptide repeat protein [Deltaproteobacteria bacterium]|nr:MAG: tetratricopeptide repeat protein [Deltaproteobacteria bacterium]
MKIEMSKSGTVRKTIGMSLAVLLLFFALVEVGAWCFGVVPLSERSDPFLGFSDTSRLFRIENGRVEIDPRHGAFRKVSFTHPKPKGVFRIFVFGGSTVWGWPMGDAQAFPAWLEKGLQALAPGRQIEVHNLGAGSYASWRIRRLAREAAAFSPDLFVLYMGNNEFLEKRFYREIGERARRLPEMRGALHHLRTYTLLYDLLAPHTTPQPDDPFTSLLHPLDLPVRHDPEGYRDRKERAEIIRFFAENLEAIRSIAEAAGSKILVCTLPVNLLWTGPTRSVPVANRVLFERARRLQEEGKCEAALPIFERLAAEQPDSAELWFRIGRCRYERGDLGAAREALLTSLSHDLYPQRILPEMNGVIRSMAGVLLCDLDAIVSGEYPGGLIGEGFFIDTMHPSVAAHKRIAMEIGRVIVESGLLGDVRWSKETFQQAISGEEAAPTGKLYAQKLYFVGKTHLRAGEYEKAIEALRAAIEVAPYYAPLFDTLGTAYGKMGRNEEALAAFREAYRLDPDNIFAMLNLAIAERNTGRFEEAISLLRKAIGKRPDFFPLHLELARTAFQKDDLPLAQEAATSAVNLKPTDREAVRLLSLIESAQGDLVGGIRRLEALLADYPQDVQLLTDLARLVDRTGDAGKRDALFARALAIDPDYPFLHVSIAETALGIRDFDKALHHLDRAIALDPKHPYPYRLKGEALFEKGDREGARRALEAGIAATGSPLLREQLERLKGL